MEIRPRIIQLYRTAAGVCPFNEWLETLDKKSQAIVETRFDRVTLGNFGDYDSVGEGVFELRIHYGPGLRIYYGLDGEDIVLLLLGGTKKSQKRDIKTAQRYWKDYKQEQR